MKQDIIKIGIRMKKATIISISGLCKEK